MSEFGYSTIGFSTSFLVNQFPKRFKAYKRNGKTFYRDYKRDMEGGISSADLLILRIKESENELIKNLHSNIYTTDVEVEQ